MPDRPHPNGPYPPTGPGQPQPGQPQPGQPQPGQPQPGQPIADYPAPSDHTQQSQPGPDGWAQTQAGWPAEQQYGAPQYGAPQNPGQQYAAQQGWAAEQPAWAQQAPAQQGYPQQQYAQQQHPQPGYGQPPPERKSMLGWVIGVGVVLAVALAGVLVYLQFFTGKDNAKDTAAAGGSGAATASEHSSETVAAITPCSSAPTMTGQSVTQTSAGLSVRATMTAACPGGDVIANDDFQVSVAAGGKDVAAGSFDLSAAPIVLQKGQSADVEFVFPAGAYWRPADMATGQLALTATLAGSAADVPQTSVRNPTALTAAGPGTPKGGSADAAALATLEDLRSADAATLSGLQGRWLPQISSKKVGLVADGITWDNAAILQEFLDNQARYPEALLLWSGDWASYDSPENYWVTVVGDSMSTPESALAWCVSKGLDQEHCLAKVVNKTGGAAGTTKLQPR